MIDYLNPHHVYIDAQSAPDLSMEVKRDANIIPETVARKKKKKVINRKLSDAEQEIQQLVHRKEVDAELNYEGHGLYGLYIDGELVETGPWDEIILKYEDLKGIY